VHLGVGGDPSRFDPIKNLKRFKSSLAGLIDLSKAQLLERRGGRIPVGGVLRHIMNDRGLLVGDAAGAVSPLTAGGLDPCMRLSTFAAGVVWNYLKTHDRLALKAYSGELFRARFVYRLWMRRLLATAQHRLLVELGCALLRQPPLNSLAWHLFFGRGSFPDVDLELSAAAVVEAA
jgi:flavin-dependent dehydrogenase